MSQIENILDVIRTVGDPDPVASDIATSLGEDPVIMDEPLSTTTAAYVNALNRETYGDNVEPIATKKELERANKAAAINVSLLDYDLSIERDVLAVAEGEISPRQMQLNALTRAQDIVYSEDNGDYGLSLENMDQLTTTAAVSNPDIQVEDETFTAQYNRVLTNKAMLMQARQELVPYGLIENIKGLMQVKEGIEEYGQSGLTPEVLTKLVQGTTATKGTMPNIAVTAARFVPIVDWALGVAKVKATGEKPSLKPHVNELLFFKYWQDAIDNDTNSQFRQRLSSFVRYCRDTLGFPDAVIDQLLDSATDPSPILQDIGAFFDVASIITGPIPRMTASALNKFLRSVKGTNKRATKMVLDSIEKATAKASTVTDADVEKAVLSLQDELRRAELVGSTRPQSVVNLNPQIPGIDIEGDVLTDFDNLLKDSSIRQTASGNLELVYHGSPEKDLRVMDPARIGTNGTSDGTGFYFTTIKKDAEGFAQGPDGKIYKAVLDIKRPIYQGDREISQEQLREFYSQFLKKYSPDFMKEKNAGDIIDTMAKNAFDTKFDKLKMERSLADLEAYYEGSEDAYLVIRREQMRFFGKDGYVIANTDFDDGVRIAWLPEQVHFLNAKRTYIPPMKRAKTLEEFLASKPSNDMVELPEDLSTELGRLKAARDTKGAEQSLKNTVASVNRDPGTVRVISNDYFESTSKGVITRDNLARLGEVITEKNYALTLQRAINMLEAMGQKGLTGRRTELIEKAVNDMADTLDASNDLYRSTGISDILRSHYSDVLQEESRTGNLFALIRSNKKYKTRAAADKARRALAADESWTVPLPDGRWGVDVKIPLNGGFGTLARKEARNPADEFVRHRGLSSVFTTTSKPTYIRDIDELRELEVSQVQELGDSVRKLVKSVKGEDKPVLEAMMNTSRETGAFYKPETVTSMLKTEQAQQAYNGYRLLNDLDYITINASRRDILVKGGWKAMKYGDESLGYSKMLRLTPSETLSKMRETNRRIIFGDVKAEPIKFSNLTVTDETLEKMVNDGWVLVERSYGPDEFTQASSVYYFLNGHSLVENDIPQFVTHYVAGGRRFFDRMATYAKQLDIREDEQGVKHIVGVKTIAADLDSVGFSNKVSKINAIRRALAKNYNNPDERAITEMISKADLGDAPFNNAETFKAWCQKHGIDYKNVDNDILALADGKPMTTLESMRKVAEMSVDADEWDRILHRSAYQAYTKEAQIQKWHRSGKDLLGWNFQDLVQPVDFDKQMRYMVQDMVNARVMNSYQDMMANDFANRWGHIVKNGDNMTAKQMLNSVHKLSDFKQDPAESLRALIFAENYRAVRGTPTGVDAQIAENFDALIKTLNGKLPEGFDEIAHGARLTAAKVKEWGPLHQQRHLTSTVMMGLMRTKQFITQIAPISYSFLMKPVATAKALKVVFPMTTEMITSKGSWSKATERFLRSEKLYSPETMKLWEALKDARIFENTPYAGAFEMSDATSKWSKFDRIQFAPKNFGEIFNRVLAHTAAYYDLGYGSKGITTAKEMAEFRSLGNTLYMNMSPTGLSRIQNTELMKTLIQFKSANLRFWETALFDRNLTGNERRRLVIGLAAIGGMRTFIGAEGAKAVMNSIDDAINFFKPETLEGQPSRLEEEESVARRILEAGLLGYWSGSDGYDWGAFVRLPATELLEGFADIFSDPFKGIPSIAADTAMMNTVKDVVLSVQAFNSRRDTYQGWLDAMKVMATTPRGVPGVKDKFTAAYVWQTATMWDSRGRLTIENAALVDKVMATLGVPRMSTQDLQAAYIDDAHEKEKIQDYVTEYTRIWNLWKKSHNEAYWEQLMSLEKLPTLDERQKAEAFKELKKMSDYDIIIEERKRRMLREWENPIGSNYMTQLDNLERR